MKTGPDISLNWNAPGPFKCPTKAYPVRVERRDVRLQPHGIHKVAQSLIKNPVLRFGFFKKKGPRTTIGQV